VVHEFDAQDFQGFSLTAANSVPQNLSENIPRPTRKVSWPSVCGEDEEGHAEFASAEIEKRVARKKPAEAIEILNGASLVYFVFCPYLT
jgi:hypothetical protein